MAVLTLYLDNSILGGYFDSEFQEPTRRLWRMAENGECRFVASVVTQEEASLAPSQVVRLFARTFPDDTATRLFGLSVRWRSFMKARMKTFDAVAESRKWKEAVARETEGMTPEQTMAYFDRAAVRRRFDAAMRRAEQAGQSGVEQAKQ